MPEVIHVHAGMRDPRSVNQIHHGFERRLLLCVGVCPPRVIRASGPQTTQILPPALARETGAFQIQEDVARRRQGQSREPHARLQREQFVDGCPGCALRMLHARLIT